MKQMNLFTKQKQIDREIDGRQIRGAREKGRWGVWEGRAHTAASTVDHQQGPAPQHTGLCSLLRGCLDGRGVWETMDTRVRIAESLHCSPETILTLLTGYTPT